MKKINYILFLALIVLWAACEKNETAASETPQTIHPEDLYAKTAFNLDMRDFARAVKKAVNTNKSFRKLIKDEAAKQFDGDYDVLLSHIAGKPVSTEGADETLMTRSAGAEFTVKDLLDNTFYSLAKKSYTAEGGISSVLRLSESRTRAVNENRSIIDELIDLYPDLQVSVPEHIEDLEDEEYVPSVCFLTEEYDEESTLYLPCFEADEEEIVEIDAVEPPDRAVIVVSMNERPEIYSRSSDDTVPSTPTSLTADIQGFGVLLTWVMPSGTNSENTLGYKVYRKQLNVDNDYKLIQTVAGHLNRDCVDATVIDNQSYMYYVVAYNLVGDSEASNFVTVKLQRTGEDLPSSFTVTQETGSLVKLNWNLQSNDYGGVLKIYKRNISSGSMTYNLAATIPLTNSDGSHTDEWWDTTVTPGQKIEYKIQSESGHGASEPRYDFVFAPYRDIAKESIVRIAAIKLQNVSKYEGWPHGAPEFLIKAMQTDTSGKTVEIGEMFIRLSSTKDKQWNIVSWNDGFFKYWKPGVSTWYDQLSFYLVEQDPDIISNYLEAILNAGFNLKDSVFPTSLSKAITSKLGLDLKLKNFMTKKDESVGTVHLNYYDDPNKEKQINSGDRAVWIDFCDHTKEQHGTVGSGFTGPTKYITDYLKYHPH